MALNNKPQIFINMSSIHLNKVWADNPGYIRRFYDNLETNKKLCEEVAYILLTELKSAGVEIAQVSSRAKTLESFCEKISRKSYKNPFAEVTDFAGVRVVYLYSASRQDIEKIIENEFEIIEKVDKVQSAEDQFGYGALHYLVKIRNNHAGARYDDLKNKVCEIQVRTILQDAWALVAHHLSYKQESDVPKELRRKLNALSGLFETADDQFESIRDARQSYRSEVQESISKKNKSSYAEEANIDNLSAYLKSKFPDRRQNGESDVANLLSDFKDYGYKTLSDINGVIDSAIDAVLAEEIEYPPSGIEDDEPITNYSSIGLARTALVFMSKDYLMKSFGKQRAKKIDKFRGLIKK